MEINAKRKVQLVSPPQQAISINPKYYDWKLSVVIDHVLKKKTDGFTEFLKTRKKKDGDKLMDSTTERYSDFIYRYEKVLFVRETLSSIEKLLAFFNKEIADVKSTVIYASFKTFLEYLGFDRDREGMLFSLLWHPKKRPHAASSIKFLQRKVLSRQELAHFFIDEKNEWQKTAYSFSYDTACRRSELFKVEWRDIIFYSEEPNKWKDKLDKGVYAELQLKGKGGKMRRVHLHKMTCDLLSSMQNDDKKIIDEKNGKVRVFRLYQTSGKLYKRPEHEFYKRMVASSDAIIGRLVHPHCFRHTKLTHMADNGSDVLGIMAYAGHADISTSMIYIHVSSYKGTRTFMEFSQPLLDDKLSANIKM
jgi:integrase